MELSIFKKLSKKALRYLIKILKPKTGINSSFRPEKQEKSCSVYPKHMPYKRSTPVSFETPVPSKSPKREGKQILKQSKNTSFSADKSTSDKPTQTEFFLENKHKNIRKLRIPETELPSTKLWRTYLKISPEDPDSSKFLKIYKKYFHSMLFSLLKDEDDENLTRVLENPVLHEKYSCESFSVSDSFVTPEGSPYLQSLAQPTISDFLLESPISSRINMAVIEGWGNNVQVKDFGTPDFLNKEPNEFTTKPVVLFQSNYVNYNEKSISESYNENNDKDKEIQKDHDKDEVEKSFNLNLFQTDKEKEVKEAKENNQDQLRIAETVLNFDRKDSNEPSNIFVNNILAFNMGFPKLDQIPEIQPSPPPAIPDLSLNFTQSLVPPSINSDLPPANSPAVDQFNPFLNLKAAETLQPKYVFGSGQAIPELNRAENPFSHKIF